MEIEEKKEGEDCFRGSSGGFGSRRGGRIHYLSLSGRRKAASGGWWLGSEYMCRKKKIHPNLLGDLEPTTGKEKRILDLWLGEEGVVSTFT